MHKVCVGRYWKTGYFNKQAVYRSDSAERRMTLAYDDDLKAWWFVQHQEDGWVEWVACSNEASEPHRLDALQWNVFDRTTGMYSVALFEVYDTVTWVSQCLQSKIAKLELGMNSLLEQRSNTGGEVVHVPDDANQPEYGSGDEADGQGDGDGDGRRPKGGWLNKAVALVVSYEKQDWGRCDHLSRVLLTVDFSVFTSL